MAGAAFAAIAFWASVPRMNRNHIRSMLMGVLGLAALLQLVALEAAGTPTKAHFGRFGIKCLALVVLSVKGEYEADRVRKIGFMTEKVGRRRQRTILAVDNFVLRLGRQERGVEPRGR